MSANTTRRRYSNGERAAAVAAVTANNGSVHGTARLLGVPETSLRQWCKGDRHPELLPLSARKKRDLAQRFEELVPKLLDIVQEKMHEMTASQAVVAAGICVDKWLLLTGQPTEITSTADDERIATFRARYRRRHLVVDNTTTQPEVSELASGERA